MENMEKNEIMTTEAIEDVTEAIPAKGSALKTAGIIGVGLVGAALLTKLVLLPVAHKAIGAVRQRKAAAKAKRAAAEIDVNDMELDEIPDIE